MPKQSDTTGHLCPRPGCGGFCEVDETTHSPFSPRTDRIRVCRKCLAFGPTRETNCGEWQFPLPGMSLEVSIRTETEVLAE